MKKRAVRPVVFSGGALVSRSAAMWGDIGGIGRESKLYQKT
jgi:hypothetical protein